MRVLMTDVATLRHKNKAGTGHYTVQLIRALRALGGHDAVTSYPTPWLDWAIAWTQKQRALHEAAVRRGGRKAWLMALARGLFLHTVNSLFPIMRDPLAETLRRCQVYHEPNFIPLEIDLPTAVSVFDLSVFLYPQWHPLERIRHFEALFHKGLRHTQHLIAISEFGKRQLVDYLGWPADRVSVTYMGVRQGLRRVGGWRLNRALRQLGLPEGYLLHVGTLEPRKNLSMLVKAYCSLPAGVRDKHPLVLVGGKGWNSDVLHSQLEESRHNNVRWLGYLDDHLFSALYSGARALVFPTFYEGFGMPTIEMFACGGAVLASTADAVAETAGAKAHLIDPHDQGAWRSAMLRVCSDDDWLALLRAGTEQVAGRYTWRACAEATLAAYHRTAGTRMQAARAA